MTLTTDESNGAVKGTEARPTSAASNDDIDTDDERGVYPAFWAGGTYAFRRVRGGQNTQHDAHKQY